MARVQTRRSISLSGNSYHRLRDWSVGNDKPMSQLIEQFITDFFDMSEDDRQRNYVAK